VKLTTNLHLVKMLRMRVELYLHSTIRLHGVVRVKSRQKFTFIILIKQSKGT